MKRFKADIEQVDGVSIVRLTGELDANTAVAADDALQSAISDDCHGLILNCQQLQYISSAGLGVMLATLHACNHKKIGLAFCCLQPRIKNVFGILGLEKLINTTDTEEEAIRLVKSTT
ncbi:STAS domain-containing protein [Pontibacter sp. MBLB2868]|uniref:STAS domain-containing protein n=1 Tax=Pontibacter sp. MBLB2868 TaxID=3451555 RepID=UPI003F7516F5